MKPEPGPQPRRDSIQVLRAVAANLVVLHHIAEAERRFRPDAAQMPDYFAQAGLHGVALFFLISGFVIIQAARRETWRAFLYARLTRIYPAYWIYTSILLAAYLAAPQAMADRSGTSLIASYLLWPQPVPPLLTVGWTLIHEMYFYLVVALALLARAPLPFVLGVWALAVVAAGALEGGSAGPLRSIATSPFTLLFIAGALAGLILGAARPGASRRRRPVLWRAAVALGDASYSTYLAHVMVVSAIWRLGVVAGAPGWLLIAASLAAANLVGLASYRWLERPLLRQARRWSPPDRQR